ncbi:MAG: SDR family oxidoreductase, partial [Chloroflexi bacterium]|nr:SDR family oxidoreductase [Chloroflexota bacterium]
MALTGKVALVTGAARGIGKAIAGRLAADGADVAVADACHDNASIDYPMSGLSQLEETRDGIIKLGRRSMAVKADVTRADDVKKMVDGVVKEWGHLDILVNNAGVSASCPVAEMSEEQWDRVIDVNLKGVFLCCRAAVPHIIVGQGSGKIINLSSNAGEMPSGLMSAYCSSEAAIQMFTMVLALEVAPLNVQVNAVYSGNIKTDIWKGILPNTARIMGISEEEMWRITNEKAGVMPVIDDGRHI